MEPIQDTVRQEQLGPHEAAEMVESGEVSEGEYIGESSVKYDMVEGYAGEGRRMDQLFDEIRIR